MTTPFLFCFVSCEDVRISGFKIQKQGEDRLSPADLKETIVKLITSEENYEVTLTKLKRK